MENWKVLLLVLGSFGLGYWIAKELEKQETQKCNMQLHYERGYRNYALRNAAFFQTELGRVSQEYSGLVEELWHTRNREQTHIENNPAQSQSNT